METESQCKKIRAYLESGKKLTPLDALYMFGCFRLGARIYNLKHAGMNIECEMIEITSPAVYNGVKRVAQYRLAND